DHAGSWAVSVDTLVERASTFLSMLFSHTERFPPTLGWVLGGARDEGRFKAWVRSGEIRAPLDYSAYPELGVREIGDNVEIRQLIAGAIDSEHAERLLALVRD